MLAISPSGPVEFSPGLNAQAEPVKALKVGQNRADWVGGELCCFLGGISKEA